MTIAPASPTARPPRSPPEPASMTAFIAGPAATGVIGDSILGNWGQYTIFLPTIMLYAISRGKK